MALPVYTERLARVRRPSSATDGVIYTHPGTGTIVVRDAVATNIGSQTAFVSLWINDGSGQRAYLFIRDALPVNGTVHEEFRQVLLPGEHLGLTTDRGEVSALLTGYHFLT